MFRNPDTELNGKFIQVWCDRLHSEVRKSFLSLELG